MEIRKTSANGIDGKHRASPPSAAKPRCPVQVVARCEQTASRPNAVAVSVRRGTGGRRETMQVRKAATVGVDGEHRATARTAARRCRPIKGADRHYQSGYRISSVA